MDPRRVGTTYPLSIAQQGLWLAERMLGPTDARPYNVPHVLRIEGALDADIVRRCLEDIVRRHEIWRTTYRAGHEAPVQVVGAPFAPELALERAAEVAAVDRDAHASARANQLAAEPFDLARGPLWRAMFVTYAPDDHALIRVTHHSINDGWSDGLFLTELREVYEALASGRPAPVTAPARQYGDYCQSERDQLAAGGLDDQLEHWKRALAELEPMALPWDHAPSRSNAHRGGSVWLELPEQVAEAVHALARSERSSLFQVLLAATLVQVSRITGRSQPFVESPVATRFDPDVETTMGLMVNMLPLSLRLQAGKSFRALVREARGAFLTAISNAELPIDVARDALAEASRDVPRGQVSFSVVPQAELPAPPGLAWRTLPPTDETSQTDLDFLLHERSGALQLQLRYRTDRFEASTAQALARQYLDTLAELAGAPDDAIAVASVDANDGHPVELAPVAIARRAAASPDQPALVNDSRAYTYGELERATNRLARLLREKGVGPEVRVAICFDDAMDMIVALLAIMKAGGAYVPLDVSYPEERLLYMLSDSGSALLVTETACAPRFAASSVEIVDTTALRDRIEALSPEPLDSGLDRLNLAYVIYTSGSTGRPKGVAVQHSGIANLATVKRAMYGLGPGIRMLQIAPLIFDPSVAEIVATLAAGGTLVVPPASLRIPGRGLAEFLRRHRTHVIQATPALLAAMHEDELPDVRVVASGGENCAPALARRWGRGRKFVNAYGPTENTVCASMADCSAAGSAERLPIGSGIPGVELYVLDAEDRKVNGGRPGELLIGGVALARGYCRRPALTAERFVPDSMSGRPGARLYRTGDLVQRNARGQLEFLGRIDAQVKIWGHRIELGEVESALLKLPMIREAAALALALGEGADAKRLVALVVTDGSDLGSARASLEERLPHYMVPHQLLEVPDLPRTTQGKIDRASLEPLARHVLAQESLRAGAAAEPGHGGSVTEKVCAIFAAVLEQSSVGVDDDFFALAGRSMEAVRIIDEINESMGVALSVRDLFDTPTPRQLAAVVEAGIR